MLSQEIKQDFDQKSGLQDLQGPLTVPHLLLATRDKLHLLEYDIDDDKVAGCRGWSRSNMKYLFGKGQEAGTTIVDKLGF